MRFWALSSLVPLLLSASTLSQNVSNVLNANTEAFISQVLADWNSAGGFAVAVVRRDASGAWQVETKGYGIATADGGKMTEHTRFNIASNSKLFTALATGLLISNETLSPRLSWTSKLASVVPGWSMIDPGAAKQLTITDAMSHRSGLPRHDISYKLTDNDAAVVEKTKHLRPSAEFRDLWQYSNHMYVLLSTLPQRVLPSKSPFVEYVQEHILDPLGMNATTYLYPVANATGDFADGFTREDGNPLGNGTVRALPYFGAGAGNNTVLAGAGGVITNAVDMATWLKMLLSNGVHPDTNATIIPADVMDKAATGVSVQTGKADFPELSPLVYGGGQARGTYRGHDLIEHGGDVPGYHSQVTRLTNDGLGVMVFSNDNPLGALTMEIVKYRLIDEALGLEPIDWNTRHGGRRYKGVLSQLLNSSVAPTPRPANATLPAGGLAALQGTYKNAGYGSFELCLVSPSPSASDSASRKCKALATNATRILPGAVTPGVPTYLAEWDSPWGSHLQLSHFTRNTFNVSLVSSYPTGNASQPFWTYNAGVLDSSAVAQFDKGGVGMMGIWGASDGVPEPEGKSIKELAEVWFDKT